jgi:tRNA(Ile)-lysidine synthetase-like protein
MHQQVLAAGISPEFELVEWLRQQVDRPICVRPDLVLKRTPAGRLLPLALASAAFNGAELPVMLADRGAGEAALGSTVVAWRTEPWEVRRRGLPHFRKRAEFFDADKVGSWALLRHWRPGDRFQPSGFSAPAKLQDLFVNQGIPRCRRRELLIATTATGEIFWVEDLRISERFKLDTSTMRRLIWRWRGGSRRA